MSYSRKRKHPDESPCPVTRDIRTRLRSLSATCGKLEGYYNHNIKRLCCTPCYFQTILFGQISEYTYYSQHFLYEDNMTLRKCYRCQTCLVATRHALECDECPEYYEQTIRAIMNKGTPLYEISLLPGPIIIPETHF